MPETPDTPTPPDATAVAQPCADTSAAPANEGAIDAAAAVHAPPGVLVACAQPAAQAAAPLSPAACAELLKQHFPALFGGQPKPLKLRIQADIIQRAPGVFSKATMSAFFRRYTGSTGYLIALGKASQRFDLDGQPAGELSDEHRQLARDELARRRQVTREREQQAQALQQAQQAELMMARQARLALLRDFERTTLTVANFCALKGLTPEALTPLLDAARQEAAEAAPPRPLHDQRGPPGAAHGDRPADRPGQRPAARAGDRNIDRPNERPNDRPTDRPDNRGPGRRNDGRNNRPNNLGGPGRPGGRPSGR